MTPAARIAPVICIATRARRGLAPAAHYCCVCGRAPVAEAGACRMCNIEIHMTASLSQRARKRIAEYQRTHHCAECGYELDGAVAFNVRGELAHPDCGRGKR